jgi:uncharacterized delta-60 repeat protein
MKRLGVAVSAELVMLSACAPRSESTLTRAIATVDKHKARGIDMSQWRAHGRFVLKDVRGRFVVKAFRRKTLLVFALTFALSATLTGLALAAGGDLDQTFGGDGNVTTNFTSGNDGAGDLAIQPDGKIVAAGRASGTAGFGRFALARYKPNGALDTTFGGDGKVATNFTVGSDWANGVLIQADGKIVAAGTANVGRFALARYNPNGTLDATFSGDGKVTTNLTSGVDIAAGVASQADGKIVAGGEAGFCCEWTGSFALALYNPDGTLDTTFSGDGKVTTNFTSGDDVATDVAIQADGKIVAAGHAGFFGLGARFALARYKTDGTLDTSFSGNGKVTTNFTAGFDSAQGVAIQADGKIVAAGGAFFGERDARFALARYLGE